MRRRLYPNAALDESESLFTAALVLALFGVLSAIEATGWVMSTLFILAAATGVGGLVLRYAKRN